MYMACRVVCTAIDMGIGISRGTSFGMCITGVDQLLLLSSLVAEAGRGLETWNWLVHVNGHWHVQVLHVLHMRVQWHVQWHLPIRCMIWGAQMSLNLTEFACSCTCSRHIWDQWD